MRAIYVDKHIPRMLAVKALKRVWPKVVYSPLSSFRFADLPEPELPGPRWLRVDNLLCGICASDLALAHVEADPRIGAAALPGYQRFYLGHEVVSRVVECGSGVSEVAVGDRVLMDTRFQGATCLSQEIEPACPHCRAGNFPLCQNASAGRGPSGVGGGWGDGYTAHESEVFRVPDELSDEQAALVEPLSTGLRAALKRPPEPHQRALVVGGGIIGLVTLQAVRAVAPDCHLTLAARYPQQAEAARRLGADEVILGGDVYQQVARITGANLYQGPLNNRMLLGGFDVVYDCVGSRQTLEDSLRWARAGGSVVMVGISLAPMRLDVSPIWHQEVELVGLYAHGAEPWRGENRKTFELVLELLREGKLTTDGLITHRFPLERWKEALATSADKSSGAIKVVFDYR